MRPTLIGDKGGYERRPFEVVRIADSLSWGGGQQFIGTTICVAAKFWRDPTFAPAERPAIKRPSV